jgi:TetR/AcrR family transcriptional regulator, regulator of cefoperazone and chloramphenicol sensitivity
MVIEQLYRKLVMCSAHRVGDRDLTTRAVIRDEALRLFAAMANADWSSPAAGASLTEALLAQLPADSPVPAYLRRLLLSGDAAGHALFARWYALTVQAFEQLTVAGIVQAATDPPTRAGFLLVNDLPRC